MKKDLLHLADVALFTHSCLMSRIRFSDSRFWGFFSPQTPSLSDTTAKLGVFVFLHSLWCIHAWRCILASLTEYQVV